MMAWRRDSKFCAGPNGILMWARMYLGLKDLHGPWHGDARNSTRKCQTSATKNGKIVHNHLGKAPCEWALRFTHVVCE